ncbi:YncE family protein [Tahibacter amnicola]|uniref:YncE family protein n=1 Tax=Tahibacter amnicola TaxID=2976241 RepID=A0ABY6BII5_9GAMM|nr:YncE family protein [Tahibacter amnicola]UXI69828.1 YncE family protein [Tahibacter amnicola]
MNAFRSALAGLFGLAAASASAQNQFANWESPHVHPLDITPDGTHVLAVNTADQRLEIFTRNTDGQLQSTGAVAVGVEPVSVRVRSNAQAWVVNHLSDSISIVDISDARVVATLRTGDEPADVVFAGNPERAYVSLSQLNQVRIYDPANLAAPATTLALEGEEPRALAVSPDRQHVYVAFFESGNGTTIIGQAEVTDPAGPYAGASPPPNSGNTFDPPLAVGLPAPPPVAHIVRRDGNGRWRDDNGRDWSAFVTWDLHDHDIASIDTETLQVTYFASLMTQLMALGTRPDGQVTAVGTESLNQIRFEPNVQSVFVHVSIANVDPATGAAVIADLNPHLDYTVRTVPAATRAQSLGDPRGIAWHPVDDLAYVTGMGSNNLIVTNSSGTRTGRVAVGAGPTGVVLDAAGTHLYVLNKFDASVSVITTATLQEIQRLAFFDPTPSSIRAGRPLLYDTHATSGLGQAACASCHVDGRSDFLAWDLGSPQGEMKAVNQPCRQGQTCRDWHPMKGPLVTQTLQGIVGNGAMHWRGDRENLAAFAPAFVSLQGADAEPDAARMQAFEDFVATVRYPPNPNRSIDGSLPTAMPVGGGTGNAVNGETLFLTLPTLAGTLACVDCHALPTGTTRQVDDPFLPLTPQTMKQAQLRGLWEKAGWRNNRQDNAKGFGFNSDSEFDTLGALLLGGFNFGGPAVAPQRRRDVEAYLLAFDSETPPAVGQQLTFDGGNTTNAADLSRLDTFVALADSGRVGLIAKGRRGGVDRGWVYVTGNRFLSDRRHEFTDLDSLRTGAAAGAEVTFTVVAAFSQYRSGVDRDADGAFDRDEREWQSDPASPASLPSGFCRPDLNEDGRADSADVALFDGWFQSGDVRANYDHSLNAAGLPDVTPIDADAFEADVGAGCDTLFHDGFEN